MNSVSALSYGVLLLHISTVLQNQSTVRKACARETILSRITFEKCAFPAGILNTFTLRINVVT